MTIALSALIIALFSLMWNIISTVYSWRTSMPLARLELSNIYSGESQSVRVNVRNKGGSPIAVARIAIWEKWNKKGDRSGGQVDFEDAKKDLSGAGVTGPKLPFTINGFHSRAWTFDATWLGGQDSYYEKVLIEVELSNGKVVGQQIEIGDHDFDS